MFGVYIGRKGKTIIKDDYSECEITYSEVVSYALKHMKFLDKLNPTKIGHAVLASKRILEDLSYGKNLQYLDENWKFQFDDCEKWRNKK